MKDIVKPQSLQQQQAVDLITKLSEQYDVLPILVLLKHVGANNITSVAKLDKLLQTLLNNVDIINIFQHYKKQWCASSKTKVSTFNVLQLLETAFKKNNSYKEQIVEMLHLIIVHYLHLSDVEQYKQCQFGLFCILISDQMTQFIHHYPISWESDNTKSSFSKIMYERIERLDDQIIKQSHSFESSNEDLIIQRDQLKTVLSQMVSAQLKQYPQDKELIVLFAQNCAQFYFKEFQQYIQENTDYLDTFMNVLQNAQDETEVLDLFNLAKLTLSKLSCDMTFHVQEQFHQLLLSHFPNSRFLVKVDFVYKNSMSPSENRCKLHYYVDYLISNQKSSQIQCVLSNEIKELLVNYSTECSVPKYIINDAIFKLLSIAFLDFNELVPNEWQYVVDQKMIHVNKLYCAAVYYNQSECKNEYLSQYIQQQYYQYFNSRDYTDRCSATCAAFLCQDFLLLQNKDFNSFTPKNFKLVIHDKKDHIYYYEYVTLQILDGVVPVFLSYHDIVMNNLFIKDQTRDIDEYIANNILSICQLNPQFIERIPSITTEVTTYQCITKLLTQNQLEMLLNKCALIYVKLHGLSMTGKQFDDDYHQMTNVKQSNTNLKTIIQFLITQCKISEEAKLKILEMDFLSFADCFPSDAADEQQFLLYMAVRYMVDDQPRTTETATYIQNLLQKIDQQILLFNDELLCLVELDISRFEPFLDLCFIERNRNDFMKAAIMYRKPQLVRKYAYLVNDKIIQIAFNNLQALISSSTNRIDEGRVEILMTLLQAAPAILVQNHIEQIKSFPQLAGLLVQQYPSLYRQNTERYFKQNMVQGIPINCLKTGEHDFKCFTLDVM